MNIETFDYINHLRAQLAEVGARNDELEHEVGQLREIIRRIVGYVNSIRSAARLEGHSA